MRPARNPEVMLWEIGGGNTAMMPPELPKSAAGRWKCPSGNTAEQTLYADEEELAMIEDGVKFHELSHLSTWFAAPFPLP